MSGICGIFSYKGTPVDANLLERMNNIMAHRGPDDCGIFVSSGIGLGHRRLSVIDLDSGKQPMGNEDGSIQVAFDGAIYNFRELRKSLEEKGHRFRTRSDTESLLHAYEEWGESFAEKLRGMFAIALWDSREQKLMLIRDRLGKKPLYYSRTKNRLLFASELKAFLADPAIPREIDPSAVDAYMSFGYIPAPLSIFKSIRKLPPAHCAVCTRQGFAIREYWRLPMDEEAPPRKEEDLLDQLRSIFDEAVKIRMAGDVPLGAFLSGGIDSSLVVAAMSGLQAPEPVKTTAIGFDDKRFNELEFARAMAAHCKTDHTEFVVDPNAVSVLEDIVWHLDEPFADSSAIPTYYVSKMARQKVTVVLSGDGGDEVFAGYIKRYSMNRVEDRIRKILPGRLRCWAGSISRMYPQTNRLPRPLRLKSFLRNISHTLEEAYFHDMSFYFTPEMKRRLYRPEYAAETGNPSPFSFLQDHFDTNRNPDVTTRVQYVDMKTLLPGDVLVKVDRMSMAHSLEVRSPLLDHRLIEFAGTLPSSLKLRGGDSKYILKKSMAHRLPQKILSRGKQGFSVPLAGWLRGELREFAEQALFSSRRMSREYFSDACIEKLWNSHLSGAQDNASQLWALVMLESWHRKFCLEPEAR